MSIAGPVFAVLMMLIAASIVFAEHGRGERHYREALLEMAFALRKAVEREAARSLTFGLDRQVVAQLAPGGASGSKSYRTPFRA